MSTANCKAAEALQAFILARIHKVAKDQTVVSDSGGEPEHDALRQLEEGIPHRLIAQHIRDTIGAAIIRGLHPSQRRPNIRVAYARIYAMLNDYLHVASHHDEPDQWPSRSQVGEW